MDAVASQRMIDREPAIRRLTLEGAVPASVQSVVFEILRDSRHPLFKQASALVK
ncbi:MAG: hypothetical protein PHV34_17100 [Verrucomicrobiae bacterium]|nr:hypothetical protein [Verrucomicrobiae bacterium]